ncbi:glycoside hydrolase family protein [Sphingomonas sp. PB2P19]|uniref:glycoside hydrolase family protein n=1 Tax=Sphingomonas rhamnosi TaxID=3096156 RepID=UPI002FC95179
MSFKMTLMPDVLLDAGLKVAECEGWRERGRGVMKTVRGVMCHHTGNPNPGNMPTLEILKRGRRDLRGPLGNLGVGRDGTFYVIAAGRANHAGQGRAAGLTTGNSSFIGIEAEHSGKPADPWPAAQIEAYQRGCAALLKHIGAEADMCIAHKEFALPVGRKIDPCFDMLAFRIAVSDYLVGKSVPLPIKPTDERGNPTLRRGSKGDAVEALQEALGLRADGDFGPKTEAALREWQRRRELTPDGICGPKTWSKILNAADHHADIEHHADSEQRVRPAGAGGMQLSDRGAELIKRFEGCARRHPKGFQSYPDPGSATGRPWTIGWGSTGKDVVPDLVWTAKQCDDRFIQDMQHYVDDVSRALGSAPTNQNQFDALVSFHYNTGAVARATLTKFHKAGEFTGAAREFAKWVRNDGRVMRGLVNRREAESELYSEPVAEAVSNPTEEKVAA